MKVPFFKRYTISRHKQRCDKAEWQAEVVMGDPIATKLIHEPDQFPPGAVRRLALQPPPRSNRSVRIEMPELRGPADMRFAVCLYDFHMWDTIANRLPTLPRKLGKLLGEA